MSNFIAWIIIGGLAGWIASMIMKTNEQMGLVANIVVGVIGALIGGWLARTFLDVSVTSIFSWTSLLVAIVGAVVFLGILKLIRH